MPDNLIQREHLQSEVSSCDPGWILMWYGIRKQSRAVDWSSALRKGELNVVFNLQGCGVVLGERTRLSLVSSTISMCWSHNDLMATRLPGETSHEFVVLSMRPEWLEKTLGEGVESIFQALRKSLISTDSRGELTESPVGFLRAMSSSERDMAMQLADPPCEDQARVIWYAAKVSEIVALHMFRPAGQKEAEPFCVNQRRVNHERIDAVHHWLEEHLDQPLELELLAGDIGCAKHYLSRFYSQQTGKTISRKLRSLRVEKAGRLLLGGKANVTEAALIVGYNSLSHFTKAFIMEKGVKPSEYVSYMM